METEYKTLTCPTLVKYTVLRFAIYSIAIFVFGFIFSKAGNGLNDTGDYFLLMLVWLFLVSFAVFAYWGKAVFRSFIVVKMNKIGISNRYCKLPWEEVENYGIIDMDERSPKAFTIKSGLMICVGKSAEMQNDFRDYDLKNCIFVPYNEKTINAIEHFSNNKFQ